MLNANIAWIVAAASVVSVATRVDAQTRAHADRPAAVLVISPRILSRADSESLRDHAVRSWVQDDGVTSRKRGSAILGGIIGAAAGFAIANVYAGNHHPACVAVPDGGPCRYLQGDHASIDRVAGVAFGGAGGAFIGYVLER